MSDKTKLGLGIIVAALALGIIGDALLQVTPWGLNVAVLVALGAVAAAVLVRWRGIALRGGGRWMILPALLFAAGLAWRDSVVLGIVNTLAMLAALTLVFMRGQSKRVRIASIAEYTVDAVLAAVFTFVGAMMLVFEEVGWREIPRRGLFGNGLAVARGVFIGAPLIVFFGALFMSADAVFSEMVRKLFNWDIVDVMNHLILSAIIAWVVCGLLYVTLMGQSRVNVAFGGRSGGPLGIVEMGVALGMLNALFLGFVIIQFRYFFGGAELVAASTNLTYAEYARRGFFELVTVAALMLPLLLAADWAVRKENPLHKRIFQVLVVALVAMLYVVMYSAFQRMRLYQSEFGMTELRLYTTVFMGWIGLVFLWFVATVVRGRREQFAFGMLVSGFMAVAFLNALNPDAFIVRTNVNRAIAEQPLDGAYVASLSADAVPALVNMLSDIPESERKHVAENILKRWSPASDVDWRTWNRGRADARKAVAAHEEILRELASGR